MTTHLLCLHGMAGTGRVWDGLAELWTEGEVMAPDLAGHGLGPRRAIYGIDGFADELADRLSGQLPPAHELIVVGHSLGGAVGASLLGRTPIEAAGLVALGIKTTWAPTELAGSAAVADKGVRWFDDRAEAEDRFLKVSGLFGLVSPGSEAAASGVVEEDGRWRLLTDPEVYRNVLPPFADQLAALAVPVRLGRGAEDTMVPVGDVEPFDAEYFEIAGAGHNAHVEQPALLAAAIRDLLAER